MHRRPPSWCNWASEPKWKTERVVKHKFDDIDVDKFRNESIIGRLLYIGIFALTFKSILVYMADMVIMILSFVQIFDLNSCSNLPTNLKSQSSTESPTKDPRPIEITTAPLHLLCAGTDAFSAEFIPPDARPWILLTSILISLIFLFLDWRMAAVVIRSKDIAYAITTTIPYRYYVLKDFTTFCFFREISAPESLVERVAKFVLFGFKGWKRMLIAECPRQTLNMLTIVDILLAPKHQQRKANQFKSYVAYHEQNLVNLYAGAVARLAKGADHNPIPLVTFFLQSFTVTVWMLGISVIILATLAYIPLVCRIRGNLKEYICHKIDTRYVSDISVRCAKLSRTGWQLHYVKEIHFDAPQQSCCGFQQWNEI
ncbi:hypothetical protein BJ742DRAFT_794466 [Cladochytrium replicatum]|nr:hypothetical protein BJ742DRAFT_794466 [Cladochytrium replicatum]